ncbi:V-set domain-containing T-cell activation inhibitor 1-like isoform X1 [Stegastes partitus]|uniref:V-set domain-containing T-cell activation inhibitor 1-like isoform X1 n=1 Tax=Stegastes partitus TaxID=144197 RepID=A0A9Y4NUC0_9TELE|nr:PREDICTED: V-set domain-containing T-cell activation inhibitor 1-like isoform X1 [Stegastes partitus]
MFCSVAKLLGLFLCAAAATAGHEHGPDVTTVVVKEWDDVVLPCSAGTEENLEQGQFYWIKDDKTLVFRHGVDVEHNNSRPGEDEPFKGRMSHFPDQLKFGNASLLIEFTPLENAGNYTCYIPHLLVERFTVRLVVEPILRDRSLEIPDALVKPFARILDNSVDGVLLRCEVHGAVIKPTLKWLDADRNVMPTVDLDVYERGGRYFVFLLTAVNMTIDNYYRCEATQEEISHEVYDDVSVPEQMFESCPEFYVWIAVWFSGVLSLAAVLGLVACGKCIRKRIKKGTFR